MAGRRTLAGFVMHMVWHRFRPAELRYVDEILIVNEDVVWPPDPVPRLQEYTIGTEDLHARVFAIGHVDPVAAVHRDRVRQVELAWPSSRLTPGGDVLALRRKAMHACIAIPIADVEIAISSLGHT